MEGGPSRRSEGEVHQQGQTHGDYQRQHYRSGEEHQGGGEDRLYRQRRHHDYSEEAKDHNGDRQGDKEGWTTIRGRRHKASKQASNGTFDLSKLATNFFVSNLPANWNSSRLWNTVQHLGILVDAFVPGKMDREGHKFGFVRFVRVYDLPTLLRNLNELVLEGRRLTANVAKYGRTAGQGNNDLGKVKFTGRPPSKLPPITLEHRNHCNYNLKEKSFKDTLVGTQKNVEISTVNRIIIPNPVNLRSNVWLENCLVGELKDLELLTKCMPMIQLYGLGECNVKFIGGLCVLLEFKNKKVAECFLRNQQMNWGVWFAWLKEWDDSFRQRSRIVWLRIYGVPMQGWDPIIFSYIAEKYGRLLVLFECSVEAKNLSFGRICILTSNLDHIDAHSTEVQWRNVGFKIRIIEDGEWYPNSLLILSEMGSDEDDDLDLDDFMDNNPYDDENEKDKNGAPDTQINHASSSGLHPASPENQSPETYDLHVALKDRGDEIVHQVIVLIVPVDSTGSTGSDKVVTHNLRSSQVKNFKLYLSCCWE
ncbi:hypothetical protein LXL04_010532 [Taraxacum kok-saghyz]